MMSSYLVTRGFDRDTVLDMDHVSFTALYDHVKRMELEEAAQQVELGAMASQGDPKGIKKTADSLRRASGVLDEPESDINKLIARVGMQ